MRIDLLYFTGCPSWQKALANLETAIQEESLDVSVQLIEVKSEQGAVDHRFLGSPSFQIDGEDFWPERRDSYSMSCRVYTTEDGLKGWPTVMMLREKLKIKLGA